MNLQRIVAFLQTLTAGAPWRHGHRMTSLHGLTESEWAAVLDRVLAQTGVSASLTDAEGAIVQSRGEHTPLCRRLRSQKETLTFICAQTSKAMLAEVRHTHRPAVDLCEAGLLRMAVPILRDGVLVGQVTSCGSLCDADEVDERFLAQQLGATQKEVTEVLAGLPTADAARYEAVADQVFAEVNVGSDGDDS